MSTTPNMSIVKPTEGGDSGTWDTILNTGLDVIDLHDHSSGKGVLVPVTGLSIGADLTFGGNAATALKSTRFTGQASLTAETLGLGAKTDNELYWITAGGTEVKLTSGAGLNTSLVGGITGDYSTTDANCRYVDSTKVFEFMQDESPSDIWAKIGCGDIKLYEDAAVTNSVNIQSPGSLAASYNWIMPDALPGSGVVKLVTVDENGQLTLANEITGSDDIGHATREIPCHAVSGNGFGVYATDYTIPTGCTHVLGGSTSFEWVIPIRGLMVGDTLEDIDWRYSRLSGTATFKLERAQFATVTVINGSGSGISDAAGVGNQQNTDTGIDHVVLANNQYWLRVTCTASGLILYGASVFVKRDV